METGINSGGVGLLAGVQTFLPLVAVVSIMGDVVAKWLTRWTPDREVRVRALAGSLCCVLGQDTLLSQCLSPPRSINGYRKIYWGNLQWTSIQFTRSSYTTSRFMLRKLQPWSQGLEHFALRVFCPSPPLCN